MCHLVLPRPVSTHVRWMFTVENAGDPYKVAQMYCVYDNVGTDTGPEYKCVNMLRRTK